MDAYVELRKDVKEMLSQKLNGNTPALQKILQKIEQLNAEVHGLLKYNTYDAKVIVANVMNINDFDIFSSPRRTTIQFEYARHYVYALAHLYMKIPVTEISRQLRRNHSTIVKSVATHRSKVDGGGLYGVMWHKVIEKYDSVYNGKSASPIR